MKLGSNRRRALCLAALVALIALVALWRLWPQSEDIDESKNLISNGGFESGESGWSRDMWHWDEGVSELSLAGEAYEGESCALVKNASENDARFSQTISVAPNAYYRITCMINVEGCEGGEGATISVGDTFAYSEPLFDTAGEWRRVELYGRTGSEQTTLDIFLRVGGYGMLSRGSARFDDVSVTRVAALPSGVTAQALTTVAPAAAADEDEANPSGGAMVYLIIALAFAAICVLAALARGELPPTRAWLYAALIAGLIVRAALAVAVRGYSNDMSCFEGWADRMATVGPWGFYGAGFCDYPPGYMLLLWPAGVIRQAFNIVYDSQLHWLVVKSLPIACDLCCAVFVYRLMGGEKRVVPATLAAAFWALNPAALVDCGAWGQIDSVLALCVLAAVYLTTKRKWLWALPLFGCAILIKPQALLFAPVGVMALAVALWRERPEARAALAREIGLSAALAVGIMALICLPFSLGQGRDPFSWAFELYGTTLTSYSYVTVNACNLYSLLGLNWVELAEAPGAAAFAWVMLAASYVSAGILLIKSKRPRLYLACAAMLLTAFAFGAQMHERYAFPAILLLLAAYSEDRDWRLLLAALLSSFGVFLNSALVLENEHLLSELAAFNACASIANIAAALVALWAGWDICARERLYPLPSFAPVRGREGKRAYAPPAPRDYRLGMNKRDYALVVGLTAIYAVMAFTNLGVVSAPESGWTSAKAGDSAVFDLGESRTFRMTYYGGICDTSFTVAFSEDGEEWTVEKLAVYNQGEIFRWLWYSPAQRKDSGDFTVLDTTYPLNTARYARITSESVGLLLYEVGFIDESGAAYDIASVTGADGVERLIDEQATVPAYPSYLNGTYFDEIYHARTAFEHLNGLHPYEYTHPPLGKVLMMVGIAIFGMNPFGWRFMGALIGVLMVPAMYLLAKQLLKRTFMAFLAAFLLTFDMMHFTQTRIATIDSYSVFFIMVMYLFMLRYCQMSYYREKFVKTLIPLGLCGLFMGLAIASKWIGIYAASGLAVMFFITLFRRLAERARAVEAGAEDGYSLVARERGVKYALITLAACVVFFIVVPGIIYYLSYYWFMVPSGGLTVSGVIGEQARMFGYHKGLTNDMHFFRSPWYEWPLIIKPMWYYSGTTYMPEGVISSISCMGNPAVWWTGLAALIYALIRLLVGRGRFEDRLIAIGFAAQYLPWVLVPRSTFIYHYFASVPFIILATALALKRIYEARPRAGKALTIALMAAAVILFVMFYPLASGTPVARAYASYLRWFNWYNF